MGSVVAVIITMLLLLHFLLVDRQLAAIGGDVMTPCDAAGIST